MIAGLTTPRKATKAYYCWLHDRHGVLMKDESDYVFMDSDTEELTIVEPIDFPWIMVCGEVGITEAAALADTRHGGCAAITCTRASERG